MASQTRQPPDPVATLQALHEQPYRFSLFAALRWIECAYAQYPRLGNAAKPADDPVRLRQTPTLAFAPSEVQRFELPAPDAPERPAQLYGLSLGLFGPNAPLPLHLTELAMTRERRFKDPTLVAFADLFHHRMLSLFYRAWASAQPTVQLDRPAEDGFRLYLNALIGLATPALQARDALPDQTKRFFAGRLLAQARNAEGLRAWLQHFFQVPVTVVEFVAEWLPLPRATQWRLGRSRAVGALGRTTVLGAQVRGVQQRFRLQLGPLRWRQFQDFLPQGEALALLTAAVRTYAGDAQAWDVQLRLCRTDVPSLQLSRSGRLGLSAWLGRYQAVVDADQTVLRACS